MRLSPILSPRLFVVTERRQNMQSNFNEEILMKFWEWILMASNRKLHQWSQFWGAPPDSFQHSFNKCLRSIVSHVSASTRAQI